MVSDAYLLYTQLLRNRHAPATHRRLIRDRRKALWWTRATVASVLTENPILLKDLDKVFASTWINDRQVVIGTKDNKLLVLDTVNHTQTPIEVIIPSHSRRRPTVAVPKHAQLGREAYTPSIIHARRFGGALESTAAPAVAAPALAAYGRCEGIRSMAVNPSNTILAVALADPACVILYRLADLYPLNTIATEHSDAVFSVQWADDTTLITGSRDSTLGVWGIGTVGRWKTGGRVRDIKLLRNAHQVASLNASGTVEIWDINRQYKDQELPLPHTKELVCLAHQHQRLAVGSQSHITLLDPRCAGGSVHVFESQDKSWGVRSLALHDPIVTCGGGMGRVSFYDLRSQAYVLRAGLAEGDTPHPPDYYNVSGGWLDEANTIYRSYFHGQHRLAPQAVYTLTYSPDETKLFTAGGPIQTSLKGCYAAVWSCFT
ncbi:WD40-repeat-containing domain protein [Dichotomocladium elegans]|nr:WD40-repeat-containing domain protein [Dichotomocladium elegans]